MSIAGPSLGLAQIRGNSYILRLEIGTFRERSGVVPRTRDGRADGEERIMSRLRCSLVAGFFVAACWPSFALAQFPYEGVTTTKVKVRSGPSENHYQTGILHPNSPVTVVRDEPSGWLAIEPPEDSFCWISSEFVRELSATEGEVTGDNVLVRIGTPIDERLRDSWQKKLKRGDRIHILDKRTAGQGQLTSIWYKILPPPGEVRYVSAQYVQPIAGRKTTQRSANAGPTPKPNEPANANDKPPSSPKRALPRRAAEPDDEEPDRSAKEDSPTAQLDRANAAYKEMMKQKIGDRDVDRVLSLYEQAAKSAKSDTDHALIAQRIEELEEQQERKAKFAEFDKLYKKSKERDKALLEIPKKQEEPSEPTPPRYDASGILRRSTAIIDGKPAYVLVSPQGGIRCYVTPSPGLDFKKHLDQLVAVRGPARYRTEVRHHHITVRDITPLDLGSSTR
jgi:hypothetical protein